VGTTGSSLELKRPGRETDHSPPSSADIQNAWNYASTPQYAFVAWRSVQAQRQIYLFIFVNFSHWCRNLLGGLIWQVPVVVSKHLSLVFGFPLGLKSQFHYQNCYCWCDAM
jgi:hypothetical protein